MIISGHQLQFDDRSIGKRGGRASRWLALWVGLLLGAEGQAASQQVPAQQAAASQGIPSRAQVPSEDSDLKPSQLIDGLFRRAQQALQAGESEAGESDLRFIVSASLDQLGALHSAQRRWPEAEESYLQAARASAFAAESLMGLGIVYLRSGDYQKGRQTLKQLLRLNPLNPDPHHLLGKMLFMEGDYQTASSELRDAYSLGSGDLSVAYTLALAYLKQQRPDEAQRVFTEMEEKVGPSPRFSVLRGRALRETGYLEEAVTEFRRALEQQQDFPRAHYYLGLTLLMRHHREAFPEALSHFQAELRHSPRHYPSLFFSGVVLAFDQRHEEALPFLQEAGRQEPERPDPHLFLGQSLLKLERFENAVRHLRQAIELTPDLQAGRFRVANAHFSLGQALLRSGKREEAQVHIEASRQLKRERFDWEAEAIEEHMKGTSRTSGASDSGSKDARPSAPSSDEGDAASRQLEAALAAHRESSLMLVDLQPQAESGGGRDQAAGYYPRRASSAYQLLGRIYVQREDFAQAARFLGLAAGWNDEAPDLYFNWALACMKARQPGCAVQPLVSDLKRHPQRDAAKSLLAQAALQLVESKEGEAALQAVDLLLGMHPEVADLHLLKGRVLALAGRFQAAAESFAKARQRNPSIAEVHYFEGMALLRQSKLKEALASFERQLKVTPQHAKALYHKAFLLDALGRAEEAPPLLREAIRADPDYAEPYYQLGKMQLKRGEVLRATMNLETASRLNPQASYIHYQLSRAYARAGRQDAAQEALKRYRELKEIEEEARLQSVRRVPGSLQAYPPAARAMSRTTAAASQSPSAAGDSWQRLRSALRAGRLQEARALCLKALQAQPDSVRYLRALTGIELKLGNCGEGLQNMRRALQRAPHAPDILYEWALVSLECGGLGDGIHTLRILRLMSPQEPRVLFQLGKALLQTPDLAEALDILELHAGLRPRDPAGLRALAYGQILLTRFGQAQQTIDRVRVLGPGSWETDYYQGALDLEQEENASAEECFRSALRGNPRHGPSHLGLGKVLLKSGRPREAIASLKEAGRILPERADVHFQLSRAYSRLGQQGEARRQIELFREKRRREDEALLASPRDDSAGQQSPQPSPPQRPFR